MEVNVKSLSECVCVCVFGRDCHRVDHHIIVGLLAEEAGQ